MKRLALVSPVVILLLVFASCTGLASVPKLLLLEHFADYFG